MDAARAEAASAPRTWRSREGTWTAASAVAYLAVAIVFTWPLARGLASDVPSDLGDSLLNMWILSWDAEQLRRLFTGDFSVLLGWFDGNIFYPIPDALAYSEHLIPQAIQIFPVYLVTRNPILCYNLLFLSTYILAGLGTYLLVRELTGSRLAAFVAGLIFGFIPYRIPQISHLQVITSQWMPFTFYGLTRYLNTGRRPALAGGASALALQGLSCGYYLIYFSPFAAGYVLWELARRGQLRNQRRWVELVVAGIGVVLVTAPFLVPYARVQAATQITRRIEEVSLYSADVYAYFTAVPQQIWGPILQIMPKPEGELFMGAVPMLLALAAAWFALNRAWRAGRATETSSLAGVVLGVLSLVSLGTIVFVIFARRLDLFLGPLPLRIRDLSRPLAVLTVSTGLWLALSARGRARLRACLQPEMFFLVAIVVAWWLSLGPEPRSLGRLIEFPALYRLFYNLPGVDGVRVPARLAMVIALMLAVLGGYAMSRIASLRRGASWVTAIALLFLIEARATEFPINGLGFTRGYADPEPFVLPPASAPRVYQRIAALQGPTVLLEMPLGSVAWDVRAVYYSTAHWKPLVNGYSGFFPAHYQGLVSRLLDPDKDPVDAWQAVRDSGATHLLIHERAFRQAEVDQIRRWLGSQNAEEIFRERDDVLFRIRR